MSCKHYSNGLVHEVLVLSGVHVSHVVIWPVTIRIIMALRDTEGQMYPDILTNYMQY